MTEPHQQPQPSPDHQDNNGIDAAQSRYAANNGGGALQDQSGQSYVAPDQPQYGQRVQPEFGALASQFPAGYDPYLYGREPIDQDGAAAAEAQTAQRSAVSPMAQRGVNPSPTAGRNNGQGAPNNQYPYPYYGAPQNAYGTRRGTPLPGDPNYVPNYFHGIDLNDPAQNPVYGRWDMYAIISFVCAIVFTIPLMPAVMGAIAIWRTRKFHTRGFALAMAAVIINGLVTVSLLWLSLHGYSLDDLYMQMMSMMGGSGSSGGDVVSA